MQKYQTVKGDLADTLPSTLGEGLLDTCPIRDDDGAMTDRMVIDVATDCIAAARITLERLSVDVLERRQCDGYHSIIVQL